MEEILFSSSEAKPILIESCETIYKSLTGCAHFLVVGYAPEVFWEARLCYLSLVPLKVHERGSVSAVVHSELMLLRKRAAVLVLLEEGSAMLKLLLLGKRHAAAASANTPSSNHFFCETVIQGPGTARFGSHLEGPCAV